MRIIIKIGREKKEEGRKKNALGIVVIIKLKLNSDI